MLGLVILFGSLWLAVQFSPVQNWLVHRAAKWLSQQLHTEVQVQHVDFSLFNKVLIEGVLVKDLQKDTLLYAGRLGVRITDWFFLKDSAQIHYASLEHVYVYLHRSDSIWNYQFIADYFSAPASSQPSQKKLALSLQHLQLSHIRLLQKDEWRGEDLAFKLDRLIVEPRKVDFGTQIFDIHRLEIESPSFSITNYTGKRPQKPAKPDAYYHSDTSAVHWNDGSLVLKVENLLIRNGAFRNEILTAPKPDEYFDGNHIHFFDINARLSNVEFITDTLKADIALSATERSGFEVKQLNTRLQWHPQAMEFYQLDLQTNQSRLGDYFAMRYTNFNHDMSEFITHVRLEGNFVNSTVATDDIAFFAPALKDWNDKASISGKAWGTIDHLKAKDLRLAIMQNTFLDGDFTMDGLPDIENTFFDIKARQLRTQYRDLAKIMPALNEVKQPDIAAFGTLNFTGNYAGFISDFVAYGTLRSNLGTLVTDINFKIPGKSLPIYSGKVRTDGFQLGKLLAVPSVGTIAAEATLKGKGFEPPQLYAELKAKIFALQYNQYTYKNIETNGILDKRQFEGAITIADPHLSLHLSGLANLRKDTPVYQFQGSVYQSNLKNLGLTKDDVAFEGKVNVNMQGKNIDEFLGTINVYDAGITHKEQPLSFDHLELISQISEGEKQLLLQSNEFDASLKGIFNILDLKNAAISFLHQYYPSYIPAPERQVKNQDFTYRISTRAVSPFVAMFHLPLSGFDYSNLSGRINLKDNQFETQVNIPAFSYNQIAFSTLNINGTGNLEKLNINAKVDEIKLSNSLQFPKTEINILSGADRSNIQLITAANQAINEARLNAIAITGRNGIELQLQPSSIIFNNRTWQLQKEAIIFAGNNSISIENLGLSSGLQQIVAYTHPSEIGNSEDIIVDLRRVELGDFLPYLLTDPRLEGTTTGRVTLMNPLQKLQVEAVLTTERFYLNNDSIGLVKLEGSYNSSNSRLQYKLISDNLYYNFDAAGWINLEDTGYNQMNHVIQLRQTKISPLENYLRVIMKDLKGLATGTLQLSGLRNSPDLTGRIRLRDASFVLDYTQCKYAIDDTELNFRKGEIDFGNIRLRDTTNRTARLSGKIFHRFFEDMAFDLSFRTENDQRGLLVLNTGKQHNELFYGLVFARAQGALKGPLNNMVLKISGEPTDSSKIALITSDTRVTGTADYIVFRRYGREMEVQSDVKETSSLLVDLDIIANPLAKVDIVLDEITQDIVHGQGNGFLNIRVGTNESLSINGTYEITRGEYTFNWQSLIKKPFVIDKGNIVWSGDPYNAKINIAAKYTAKDVYLPQQAIQGASNERGDIIIVGVLTNTLLNPNIQFRFELPAGNPWRNNPLTMAGLKSIQDNVDEMNKQVASVLLFNAFIGSQQTVQGGSWLGANVATGVTGTVSQFLSQQLSSTLNNFVEKVLGLKDFDPYVTINPNLTTGYQPNQGVLGTGTFGFTQRLLDGRIILKAGATYLAGAQNGPNNNQVLPDFSLEYFITPDGKLRLIGFYKNVFDIQWQRSNRAGASLSYVKEFDLINQIFTSDKKINKREK